MGDPCGAIDRRIFAILIVVLLAPLPVWAQGGETPTPTLTVTPWPRATLTLFPTAEATALINVGGDRPGEIADMTIQMYNFANQSGMIDFIIFVVLTLLVIGLLVRAIGRAKEVAK